MVGTTRLPVPVVVKPNVPPTLVLAARVMSALLVVILTSPPELAAVKVNASESVKLNAALPVRAKLSELKLLANVCAAELSRRLSDALLAAKVSVRSVSKISLALMVKPAG